LQTMLNVVIVEDDVPTRQTLCNAIAALPGMQVAAAFGLVLPAIEWLVNHPVDVLLTDLGLPDGSGISVIKACAAAQPQCDIMVITMFGDEQNVLASIDAGALGYILKDADSVDVGRFIADMQRGGSPMSPLVARKLLARARGQRTPAGTETLAVAVILSAREAEVLDLIARGYTYSEIGVLLKVATGTVQSHVKNTYGKLAVHNRSEAVFEANKLGLLSPGLLQQYHSE
jgi:DNA-binding NarL/FixJ family response regulator